MLLEMLDSVIRNVRNGHNNVVREEVNELIGIKKAKLHRMANE